MSKKKLQTLESFLEEALVPEEEWPYEVPGNWVWVTSDSVLKFIGGGTPSKSIPSYWHGDIPWATVKDIKSRLLNQTIDFITEEGFNNSSTSIAEPNELLLITRMSPGKCTITNIRTSINQDLKIVRSKVEILPYFLWLYFSNNKPIIESMSTGTTVKGIQLEKLKKLPFSLPPVAEQKRIIDRVECLLSKIDEAKQLIEEAKKTFELRRAAILDKAFCGELTEQWRSENIVENPRVLYEKIEVERMSIIDAKREQSDVEQMFADNPVEEVINGNGWLNLKANMFCFNITCGSTPSAYITDAGEVPFLKVYNIVNNKIAFDYQPQYIPIEIHQEKLRKSMLEPDDVIMNIVGPPLKKIAMIPFNYPNMNMNQAIVRFRPIKYILPKYIYYCLQYDETLSEVINETRGVVGQSNISISQSRNLSMAIPSIEEQKVIVEKVEAMIQKEEAAVESLLSTGKLKQLEQSILSKAFKGELGTNDSADEHAIELLKEVLQEQLK